MRFGFLLKPWAIIVTLFSGWKQRKNVVLCQKLWMSESSSGKRFSCSHEKIFLDGHLIECQVAGQFVILADGVGI